MYRDNFMKEKLESGENVIGTWCVIPSPVVSDIICSAGLDFVIIDSEHGPIGFETAQEFEKFVDEKNIKANLMLKQKDPERFKYKYGPNSEQSVMTHQT